MLYYILQFSGAVDNFTRFVTRSHLITWLFDRSSSYSWILGKKKKNNNNNNKAIRTLNCKIWRQSSSQVTPLRSLFLLLIVWGILINNRPFPSCPKPLFQSEVKCEAIDMKMTFYSHANKNFALSPVVKMRVCGTRKWPIHHAKKIFPVTVRQWVR